jgi:predicted GIY-YIG superfamily endonuclease
MELKTVKYNYYCLNPEFKNEISVSNIIYLFYKNSDCLYIGETNTSLSDRCYRHTPKESDKPWFKEGNLIHIIKLDANIDNIARQALESSFILAYRPKYNKKG